MKNYILLCCLLITGCVGRELPPPPHLHRPTLPIFTEHMSIHDELLAYKQSIDILMMYSNKLEYELRLYQKMKTCTEVPYGK